MRTTKNPELRVNMPTNITLDEKTASALLFGVREPLLEFISNKRKERRETPDNNKKSAPI